MSRKENNNEKHPHAKFKCQISPLKWNICQYTDDLTYVCC